MSILNHEQKWALQAKALGEDGPTFFPVDISRGPGRFALRAFAYGLIAEGYTKEAAIILSIVGKTDEPPIVDNLQECS